MGGGTWGGGYRLVFGPGFDGGDMVNNVSAFTLYTDHIASIINVLTPGEFDSLLEPPVGLNEYLIRASPQFQFWDIGVG